MVQWPITRLVCWNIRKLWGMVGMGQNSPRLGFLGKTQEPFVDEYPIPSFDFLWKSQVFQMIKTGIRVTSLVGTHHNVVPTVVVKICSPIKPERYICTQHSTDLSFHQVSWRHHVASFHENTFWGVPRGTPGSHPFLDGIFHKI